MSVNKTNRWAIFSKNEKNNHLATKHVFIWSNLLKETMVQCYARSTAIVLRHSEKNQSISFSQIKRKLSFMDQLLKTSNINKINHLLKCVSYLHN